MKMSLKNDTALNATKPTNDPGTGMNMGIRPTGPTQAPQEKLLAGQMVSFKNAEDNDAPILVSYNSPDPRRQDNRKSKNV